MTPFMPTVTLSPDALVRIEGGEVITWAECERRLLAARTPVVPVGVSERMDEVKSWVEDAECSRGCSSWRPDVHGRSRCDCGRGDALEATSAILAALRPTDTGRE